MPLRNLFGRRTATANVQDENAPPSADSPGFERVDTIGSKASSAMSIRSGMSIDTGSYKLSVVNDSGVYLPPSPTEEMSEKGMWSRRYLSSRTSSDAQSSTGEIEHFPISRESFDSYRRSFDISAKSPVVSCLDYPSRQSLDSSRFTRLPPRSRLPARFGQPPSPTHLADSDETEEEDGDFEEVGLDGDNANGAANKSRRRFFGMFDTPPELEAHTETSLASLPNGHSSTSAGVVSRFLPGRKRGQSGVGAELRPMGPPPVLKSGVEAGEVQAVH